MKNNKNLPQKSGIYMFKNLLNNAVYIGQSSNIYKRVNSHHLYEYKNENNGCYYTKFYSALRKYGLDNFEVFLLEECDIEKLNEREIYYISKFNSYNHGYNSTLGGQSLSENLFSKETEQKRAQTREKNSSLKSDKHPRAKLTNQEVINIRQRYIDGEDIKSIYKDYAEIYSSIDTFRRIVLGYTYQSVGNIPSKSQIRKTNAKLTENQVRDIRRRYESEKISFDRLGKEYGLSGSSIQAIVKRETYKNVN